MAFEHSNEYQRILEILSDYWLEEPEEEQVEVFMRFKHKDGREQEKIVTWKNPNCAGNQEKIPYKMVSGLTFKCPWCKTFKNNF